MKTKFYLKPSVLSLAVAGAVAVAGGPAYAVDAKISGQVNRALMNVDDGRNSETYNVDNDNSSTRFRFTGSGEMMPGITAGLNWEVEFQSNASDSVSQTSKSSDAAFGERIMEVYFQGGFGKISLGQGDGAMNGGVEVDLSGTNLVSYAGTRDVGGSLQWRTSAGGLSGNGVTIGSRLSQQDFESRYDRLRYDTPSLGGFVLSADSGQSGGNDVVEYGFRYNGDFGGGTKLSAAYGFSNNKSASNLSNKETTGGSLSLLLSGGLNFTFGMTNVENDPGTGAATTESDFTYFKVGYKAGKNAFSVDYAKGEDEGGAGNEAEHTGIQWVYTPISWANIFAGYKVVSFDDATATSFDDLNVLFVGSRITF